MYATLTKINPGVEIKHDGILNGNQIDVYWYVNIAGIEHLTIVECKNYSGAVGLGEYRQLANNMSELKARGVLITTQGFQSGVITKAREREDMTLLKVNFQESPGPTLQFGLHAPRSIQFSFDEQTTTIQQWETLSVGMADGTINDWIVYSTYGSEGNIEDLAKKLPLDNTDEDGNVTLEYSGVYLRLPTNESVRISGVTYQLRGFWASARTCHGRHSPFGSF
ncbi:restriction endonuclease [Pantoea rodasii]|uniref:restriction endonuclease n=1 Tax=Pantoea rodasii TaxID=1076549 RepID=UPI0009078C85|nr:restriction endonuclease [Pantoea rodasii]